MKKMMMTMVALLAMTVAVAQSENKERKAPKQPTAEEMTQRMSKDLKLTDEQQRRVLQLNQEYMDVLGAPGMMRRPGMRPPKAGRQDGQMADKQTDGQTAATAQEAAGPERRQMPKMTDEQRAQLKQQMEKRQEYAGKLKEVLSDEQYQQWQKQHHRRGLRGPRGQRPQRGNGQQKE